jgi:hypothetical protein
MKTNKTWISAFTLVLALIAAPAFAQRGGLGAGVGLGGQTNVGAGTGAGVQAGNTNVGVKTNTNVQANTSAQAKSGAASQPGGASVGGGIASRIESNPQLAARVESMLPPGSSVSAASAGFKNEGQFIAALHVSQNLGIPFDSLKAKMTGSSAVSLGAAIKELKPGMKEPEAKDEAKKAESQAKATASAKASASAAASTKK